MSPEERTRSQVVGGVPVQRKPRVLVLWDGGFHSRDLEPDQSLVIGRSENSDLQVDDASVSRRHASVEFKETVYVRDLGSTNGTRVGGTLVPKETPIVVQPGEIVEIGIAMLLVQQPTRTAPATAGSKETAETPMQRLHRLAGLVAASDLSVILVGESGVGKEVIAEKIRCSSLRASAPFIKLNCAALSESLLESELFGYERGAFTGAVRAKPGLVEAADTGTLFLDEIGELPLPIQAKLLRVVETRETTRLGNVTPQRVDVRFLAATNRNLEALVASGGFRQDLYFRLNGITLPIPPLRERLDEVPALARQFAAEASARHGRPTPAIRAETLNGLCSHSWPGNVRELKAVVERAVVLSAGEPVLSIPPPEQPLTPGVPPREVAPMLSAPPPENEREAIERRRAELERESIMNALAQAAGNQTKAANILGISRRTLLKRLDTYGLPRPRKGG